ncbi:rust resistance kinase Lr10 [Ziziphus jujuba]|uniref:Rust resistance kinase Lr10 n=1 Tax=Ziziphus jujuba TaxID=326968 RepID=A0ABM3IKW5_ZIZJJ|nr:rust resistance kinase Lr10 [Ziziphus jujuba]
MGGDVKINSSCAPSSCGNIRNIRSPFRLIDDPENCGDHRYNLSCENNLTVLYLSSGRYKYYVQEINYTLYTIRLVDAGIQKDNCSSIPRYSIGSKDVWDLYDTIYPRLKGPYFGGQNEYVELTKAITYVKCANSVSHPLYVDAAPCTNNATNTSSSTLAPYSYVYVGWLNSSELRPSCQIEHMSFIASKGLIHGDEKLSYEDVHNQLVYGFELSWLRGRETPDRPLCFLDPSNQVRCGFRKICTYFAVIGFMPMICAQQSNIQRHFELLIKIIGSCIMIRFLLGTLFPMVVLIYRWRRRHLSMYDTIEDFLQRNNNLMPIRYSYSDIKKMTRGFEDKLGEGGFGSVFKGKLRSGRYVAIKMLGKSNANGQDFINEVATIGRIHHANVVQLIGFCVEGSKRALVYEFMPNGSLDKFMLSKEGSAILSYEQMLKISLGVARGIEYLHQGCNMQILHFDIKPHNVLLDENFTPKVSDFGLAKLYPTDNSIVSLTAIRGTIGYMAPELFYKNIGGVSYKADVYSFGMLLMEIMGKRKKPSAPEDRSSEMYFPDWVYDQVSKENDTELEISMEEERKLEKKMIIVALWCIQMRPSYRPSMSKVIEMLEGEIESLELPPKPFLCPQGIETEDFRETTNSAYSSGLSGDSLESNQLLSNSNKGD